MTEFQPWVLSHILAYLEEHNIRVIVENGKPKLDPYRGTDPKVISKILPHLSARRDEVLAHFFGVRPDQKTTEDYQEEIRKARLFRAVELFEKATAEGGRVFCLISSDSEDDNRGLVTRFRGKLPDAAGWLCYSTETLDTWERLQPFSRHAADESCPD